MIYFPRTALPKGSRAEQKGVSYIPNAKKYQPDKKQNGLSDPLLSGENLFSARIFTGSLTVEASIAFTLFFYACALFFTFFAGQSVSLKLQKAMDEIVADIARWSAAATAAEKYTGLSLSELTEGNLLSDALAGDAEAWEELLNDDTDILQETGQFLLDQGAAAIWQPLLQSLIVSKVGAEVLDASRIQNGSSGLSLSGSRLYDRRLELVLRFTVVSPISFPVRLSYPVVLGSSRRLWTGTAVTGEEETQEDETLVYVTEKGEVYHRSQDCRVLKITVCECDATQIGKLRNADRGRYYPCEYCLKGKARETGTVYYTKEGTRYHSEKSCRALKRTMKSLALSEAQASYRPCSYCGGIAS